MEVISNIPDYEGVGIYAVVDENGIMYIGSSVNVKRRLLWHSKNIPLNRSSTKLWKAYQEGHKFKAEIIEKLGYGISKLYLLQREEYYIKKFETVAKGYNVLYSALGADYHENFFRIIKNPAIKNDLDKRSVLLKLSPNNVEKLEVIAKSKGESLDNLIDKVIDTIIERTISAGDVCIYRNVFVLVAFVGGNKCDIMHSDGSVEKAVDMCKLHKTNKSTYVLNEILNELKS